MIRHIVLLRASDTVKEAIEELAGFCAEFDGVVAFESGVNISIEFNVMHGFTHGFSIDFVDESARDRYVHDPGHKTIGAKLVSHCVNARDDIVVCDITI